MSKFIKYFLFIAVWGVVLGGGNVLAQTSQAVSATTLNAQVSSSTPAMITSLSATSTIPGQWIVINGQNLGRKDVYVDSVKVPLANILYTDALGRNIKYRVQTLTSGIHTLNIIDSNGNFSNPVTFTVTNDNQAEFSDIQRIFDAEVSTLGAERVWRVGQSGTITWKSDQVVGTIDIYLCHPVAKKCLVLGTNSLNDGAENFVLPTKTLVGDSYVVVRSHHNLQLSDRSLPFMVSAGQSSNPFKNIASVIGALFGF